MKLATYKDGSRDGQLVVVSRDLATAHYATGIASKLQQVLDDWNFMSPQLQDLYQMLDSGKARHAFPFDPTRCMAPLPRACQWASSSAFTHHLELACQARHAEAPPTLLTAPCMYQGSGSAFIGPCDEVLVADEAWDIDFEAGVAVITGDIPRGAGPGQALDGIRLVVLANEVSLRQLMADEGAQGSGFVQGKPTTAFSPVAVTTDELVFGGDSIWKGGRLHLSLQSTWNGRKVGMCDAGADMTFDFGQLLAHLCKTRPVKAGSVIGSGPVSNRDASLGYSCIADKRALETLADGAPKTAFMKFGDTLRIEAKGKDGQSVFGAIDQKMVSWAQVE